MWNDEIKQNIINELNEQFDSIDPIASTQNHSYADSIFSSETTNLFKPMATDVFEVPNYFETMISRNRTIKEVPVHTLAFADSFEPKRKHTVSLGYAPTPVEIGPQAFDSASNVYDMDQIIHSSNAVTISLTAEQRGVALRKRVSWKDIWFEDVALIKNTSFAEAVKKICSIQINL